MSCYKFIHLVTNFFSNPKDIKVIHKVVKTQGFHLELGQNLGWSQKGRVSRKQRKKKKVKLRSAPILVLPRVSPCLFLFPSCVLFTTRFCLSCAYQQNNNFVRFWQTRKREILVGQENRKIIYLEIKISSRMRNITTWIEKKLAFNIRLQKLQAKYIMGLLWGWWDMCAITHAIFRIKIGWHGSGFN
jgi:hypothetical protein